MDHRLRSVGLLAILTSGLALALVADAQTRIDSITPSQGPIGGGAVVTIAGAQLTGATLTLDGNAIDPISASDSQIVFRTPKHNNGIASIAVRGGGPVAYAEFLYLPPRLEDLPPGFITTVMGMGLFRGDGRQGKQVMYYADGGTNLLFGPDGALYFSEPQFHVIRRMRTDGIVERYAGTGTPGVMSDGLIADRMNLNRPRGIAFDRAGNLIFTETFSAHRIRRIDGATGVVTTIAGGVAPGFSGDGGPALQAQFRDPTEITVDRAGNLYVLDFANARIRRIDTAGIVTTIAGSGTQGLSGDGGPALDATFNVGVYDNGGLAVDSRGNLYLADTYNARVRKIDTTTGIITTFVADTGTVYGVAVDSADNVYVAFNNLAGQPRIRRFSPTGHLERSWGMGFGFSEDETPAEGAALGLVWRILVDPNGNILFADAGRIRRINLQTGRLETVLGMAPHIIGETGPALATVIPGVDLLFLPTGELLTAEVTNYFVRKMDRAGNVTVFAGNGSLTSAPVRDGVAATAVSMDPTALALAPNGDVLLVAWNAVGRIDRDGKIHLLTSPGNNGFAGDGGPSTFARLLQPFDVGVDGAGNVFIADSNNNRIRRIDAATGIIETVAGSGPGNGVEGQGMGSYCGDGGPATQACLNTPLSLAVGKDGSMFIGEGSSILRFTGELIDRIRKVDPAGTITTFAWFRAIKRMRFNKGGNLFMGGLRIQPNGHMFQVIGDASPSPADNGDGGPANMAGCYGFGIAIDEEGNLYCSDPTSQRVRAVRFGAVMAEPGSTVASSGGTPQEAPVGQTFSRDLTVTVRSPAGTLENGIRVDFVAPATGPSCTFPSGGTTAWTLTDSDGRASVACKANSQLGSYVVSATPLALNQSAQLVLTNTAPRPRRRPVRHG